MAQDSNTGDVSFWRLLFDPSLLSVFAISFTGSVGSNAVPAALPAIASALEVGSGRLGLVLTIFYLPLILLNPVAGVLADIYGRRRIVIPALVLFAASGLAVAAVDSFEALLALRVIQAFAFAGTLPLTAALVGDLYNGVAGSTAQGLRSSVNGTANAIAPVLAGLLATLNWRYAFFLFTLALPVAGMFYLLYSEPVTPAADNDTLSELRSELTVYWTAVRSEAADRTLGALLFGGFALFFLKQGIKAYMPVFIVQELGADVSTVRIRNLRCCSYSGRSALRPDQRSNWQKIRLDRWTRDSGNRDRGRSVDRQRPITYDGYRRVRRGRGALQSHSQQ